MGRRLTNTLSDLKKTFKEDILPLYTYIKDKEVTLGEIIQEQLALYRLTNSCFTYFQLFRQLAKLYGVSLYHTKELTGLNDRTGVVLLILGTKHSTMVFKNQAQRIIQSIEMDVLVFRQNQAINFSRSTHLHELVAKHRKELVLKALYWLISREQELFAIYPHTSKHRVTQSLGIYEYIKYKLKHKHLKKQIRAAR